MLKRRNAPSHQTLAFSNPVADAVTRQRMRSHMLTFGISMYLTDDGKPAVGLLAHLGWLLALGAELASLASRLIADADFIAGRIRAGTATLADVAGTEIYTATMEACA